MVGIILKIFLFFQIDTWNVQRAISTVKPRSGFKTKVKQRKLKYENKKEVDFLNFVL